MTKQWAHGSQAEEETSNDDWVNPHDPDAEVTKLKDGATHMAYKAEHAVDLDNRRDCGDHDARRAVGDTTSITDPARSDWRSPGR